MRIHEVLQQEDLEVVAEVAEQREEARRSRRTRPPLPALRHRGVSARSLRAVQSPRPGRKSGQRQKGMTQLSGQPVTAASAAATATPAPLWRTAAYCLVPFVLLMALGVLSPIVLVPLFVLSIFMARQGRVAHAVAWSVGIASVMAVALLVVLSLPQDQATITDSDGAQIVNQ